MPFLRREPPAASLTSPRSPGRAALPGNFGGGDLRSPNPGAGKSAPRERHRPGRGAARPPGEVRSPPRPPPPPRARSPRRSARWAAAPRRNAPGPSAGGGEDWPARSRLCGVGGGGGRRTPVGATRPRPAVWGTEPSPPAGSGAAPSRSAEAAALAGLLRAARLRLRLRAPGRVLRAARRAQPPAVTSSGCWRQCKAAGAPAATSRRRGRVSMRGHDGRGRAARLPRGGKRLAQGHTTASGLRP
ncbi:translation initiation factor IF-2-like [Lynx rufus]|uniref:translation initiation factor IF-2-like n=1 Tax=Lynx rufus TaxID=61384 RepID=UPI001F127E14|nr:translation initiation factor IF-2-like [Lynx rufus]